MEVEVLFDLGPSHKLTFGQDVLGFKLAGTHLKTGKTKLFSILHNCPCVLQKVHDSAAFTYYTFCTRSWSFVIRHKRDSINPPFTFTKLPI